MKQKIQERGRKRQRQHNIETETKATVNRTSSSTLPVHSINSDLGNGGCQEGQQRQHGAHYQGQFPVADEGNDKPSDEGGKVLEE